MKKKQPKTIDFLLYTHSSTLKHPLYVCWFAGGGGGGGHLKYKIGQQEKKNSWIGILPIHQCTTMMLVTNRDLTHEVPRIPQLLHSLV